MSTAVQAPMINPTQLTHPHLQPPSGLLSDPTFASVGSPQLGGQIGSQLGQWTQRFSPFALQPIMSPSIISQQPYGQSPYGPSQFGQQSPWSVQSPIAQLVQQQQLQQLAQQQQLQQLAQQQQLQQLAQLQRIHQQIQQVQQLQQLAQLSQQLSPFGQQHPYVNQTPYAVPQSIMQHPLQSVLNPYAVAIQQSLAQQAQQPYSPFTDSSGAISPIAGQTIASIVSQPHLAAVAGHLAHKLWSQQQYGIQPVPFGPVQSPYGIGGDVTNGNPFQYPSWR